jgi:hypothetical protein
LLPHLLSTTLEFIRILAVIIEGEIPWVSVIGVCIIIIQICKCNIWVLINFNLMDEKKLKNVTFFEFLLRCKMTSDVILDGANIRVLIQKCFPSEICTTQLWKEKGIWNIINSIAIKHSDYLSQWKEHSDTNY